MTIEEKQKIRDIIFNDILSIIEKYTQIINSFPDYINEKDQKKVIYEKIEGIFHDGLGTYFELLLFDEINIYYKLNLPESDKKNTIKKMNNGKELYNTFFPNNDYNINFELEIGNISRGAKLCLEIIKEKIGSQKIKDLRHSASDFSNGNSRDIFIILESGEELNYSLKTDKSGKVAISEGQTPKIFEKVYNRYFNLNSGDYETIKLELFNTTDEKIIKKDFQNIARLTQYILIKQFKLENAKINNFKNAKFGDQNSLEYLIQQLKLYKNGKDNASVLYVDRTTGKIGFESILDEILNVKIQDFSFTPTTPRKYKYATEPGIQYKGKTFISFQVKHKRGKKLSEEFVDITIRLRARK